VTACWRQRCRRGTAAPRPTHIRRCVGRTGGPPGARRAYGAVTCTGLTTRHVGARVPRDVVASIVRVSGCVWSRRRGVVAWARGRGVTCTTPWRGGARARLVSLSSIFKMKYSFFWIQVHSALNTKVADLAILYHFQKGFMGFFSTDLAREACQHWMSACVHEQEILTFGQVVNVFPLNEMSIYMKVVSLNKLDNFHKGRFRSV
jgi:hypothetical protein